MSIGLRGAMLTVASLLVSGPIAAAAGEASADAAAPYDLPLYLRIDGAFAFQDIGGLRQDDLIDQGGGFVSEDLGSAGIIGVGVGVRISPAVRLDLTGEYRTRADLRAHDHLAVELVDPDGLLDANTSYDTEYGAWVGLANLYVDLPSVQHATPYVGAGIGFARNSFSGVRTLTEARFADAATGAALAQDIEGSGPGSSETSLAWAVMAGVSIDAGAFGLLDIGYRYIDLGRKASVTSGMLECSCGAIGSPLVGDDPSAHEIRIGVRWELDQP